MLALEYNIINWLKKFLKVYRISLKWDSDLPKKNLYIYFNERRLKMIKNTFYFMLKAIFVLEIFTFLSLLIGYVEKWLDRKAWLISKVMTSQTEQHEITIHILSNISRSNGR